MVKKIIFCGERNVNWVQIVVYKILVKIRDGLWVCKMTLVSSTCTEFFIWHQMNFLCPQGKKKLEGNIKKINLKHMPMSCTTENSELNV